jgi:hypothetical protein
LGLPTFGPDFCDRCPKKNINGQLEKSRPGPRYSKKTFFHASVRNSFIHQTNYHGSIIEIVEEEKNNGSTNTTFILNFEIYEMYEIIFTSDKISWQYY